MVNVINKNQEDISLCYLFYYWKISAKLKKKKKKKIYSIMK